MQRRYAKRKSPGLVKGNEDYEQIVVATYLDKRRVLWFHPPNEGKRSLTYAAKLKRSGVKAGVPDIWVLEPRSPYHGLVIELKRESGGVVSDAQAYWIMELGKRGYFARVCRGAADAIAVIEEYLGC